MAFKDILVHVDNAEASAKRIRVSAELAARHDAHLIGLHPIPKPFVPAMEDFTQLPAGYMEDQIACAAAAADSAKAGFVAAAEKAGIQFEWRQQEGHPGAVVRTHAR